MNDEGPQALPPPPRESRLHRFVASFGELLITLVEMAFTRLELVFVELQEWIEGLVGIVLWGLVVIFAAGATLMMSGLILIFAFWETHRLLVSLLVVGAFVLITSGAIYVVMRKVRSQRTLFATTLAEFSKDRELLVRRVRAAPAPEPADAPVPGVPP